MSDWRPYLRERLIQQDPAGFFVIIPAGAEQATPLSCPVCDRLLRSREDEQAYHEFECCNLCALHWAHPRRERWKAGWRPSQEEVDDVVSQRPPLLVTFDAG